MKGGIRVYELELLPYELEVMDRWREDREGEMKQLHTKFKSLVKTKEDECIWIYGI